MTDNLTLPSPLLWSGAAALLLSAPAVWALRRWRRHALRRGARRQLRRLRMAYGRNRDQAALLAGVSALLRHTAMAAAPQRPVAGLYGMAWLLFLDETGATDRFSRGPGRLLLHGPYEPAPAYDPEPLLTLVEDWLDRVEPA